MEQQPVDPISNPAEFRNAVMQLAIDQKTAGQNLTSSKIFNDSNMLRDYSNIAILALGGAVTYLTVAEDLIRTMWLFDCSVAFLMLAVIVSILARRSLHDFLDKVLQAHEQRYAELSSLANLAYLNTSKPEHQTRLTDALNKQFVTPQYGFWEKYGATLVNVFFLAGFLSLAISLIFTISS